MIDDTWYQRPAGMETQYGAGGLVLRAAAGAVEALLIREHKHEDWVLPKGHVLPGEGTEEAARREILEETGILPGRMLAELGSRERLAFDKKSWKRTTYFAFASSAWEASPTANTDLVGWFRLDALPRMTWPEQRELLSCSFARLHRLV